METAKFWGLEPQNP